MSSSSRLTRGLQGGLLAGATVAAFYFVGDLFHLAPLSTPTALGHAFLGPWAVELDFPIISQAANVVMYGARLLTVTALHFFAFGLLTVGAVWLFDRFDVPLNIVSGAVFGLVGYTTVIGIGLAMVSASVVAGLPGIGSAAVANLLGGGVMGLYMQIGD